jgi:hypothetical protein
MFERSEKFGENQKFVSGVAKMVQKIKVGNEVKRQQLIKNLWAEPRVENCTRHATKYEQYKKRVRNGVLW